MKRRIVAVLHQGGRNRSIDPRIVRLECGHNARSYATERAHCSRCTGTASESAPAEPEATR